MIWRWQRAESAEKFQVWLIGDVRFYLPVELTGLDGSEKQDKRTNLKLSSEDHNVVLPAWGLLALWCAGAWLYTLGWIHPRSVYPQVHVTWVLRNLGNVETFPSTGKTFSRQTSAFDLRLYIRLQRHQRFCFIFFIFFFSPQVYKASFLVRLLVLFVNYLKSNLLIKKMGC